MQVLHLCLDVGGTEIKAAPVDAAGRLCAPIRHFPARSDADAATILRNFADIFAAVRPAGCTVQEIDLAFPGPFDYEAGICRMQGIGKYDSLYGCNLRQAFAEAAGLPPQRVQFLNDAAAFALGEMQFGAAAGAQRAFVVCIGTGCGSAFGIGGRIATPSADGVTHNGYIYDQPFGESCVDDYISRRGLTALAQQMLGEPLDGKALADRATAGNAQAKECYAVFGQRLAQALRPHLDAFRPEVVSLGGQITASAALFLSPLDAECRARGIRLAVTQDTSLRTMQGLTCAGQ